MYQKESLIRRYAFILLDICVLLLATGTADLLRFGELLPPGQERMYLEVLLITALSLLFFNAFFQLDQNVFERGFYQEFLLVVKLTIIVGTTSLIYLFLTQQGTDYSRLQLSVFIIVFAVLDYILRQVMKRQISNYYRNSRSCRRIMLVTTSDKIESIFEHYKERNNWYFEFSYIVLADKKAEEIKGEMYQDVPVIATTANMLEKAKNIPLDGVFINVPYGYMTENEIRTIMHEFQQMGVMVHINIDALELDLHNKMIENLGFFKVVSYSNRMLDTRQLVAKRLMDIAGSLVGILLTLIMGLFLVPAICLDSPGKPIYSQIRVGKNGRRFKMYKFRSMYQDADARKAELQDQNEVQGAMFKMKDDPRITRVGKFIRKTSIDEMPQFFNVLKGDMSLVGTRPPTVEEVEQYALSQKRRLSVTPGMTGLWQVSGRNEIYDFDE
ncbi:MAG: sugar transferase, partial [Lachnospiraceae bacterium]|nr:sugar transferase [Lachnospiraceae bacterium]